MRKMFLAMAKDVRVVVIKLADRLHNMRTLRTCAATSRSASPRKRWNLRAFGPSPRYFNIKWELEDLSFRYLEPDKYYDLVDQMKQKRHVREEIINEAIDVLRKALEDAISSARLTAGRSIFTAFIKK